MRLTHSVPNARMLKQGQTPAWTENLCGWTGFRPRDAAVRTPRPPRYGSNTTPFPKPKREHVGERHPLESYSFNSFLAVGELRTARMAWWRRDFTVPSGNLSRAAISG